MRQGACPLDDLDEYGCAPIHNEDDEACEGWREIEMPLEQRCQQLEQVAREMYRYMDGVLNNNWAFSLPSDTDTFRHMLEDMGVSLDG